MRKMLTIASAALVVGAVGASPVRAAVVGYWRFEGDGTTFLNAESGALVGSLSQGGTLGVMQVSTTAANPVPKTSVSNLLAAGFNGTNRLLANDDADFTNNAFTLEAFIHCTDLDGSAGMGSAIVGQWNLTTNQRSYMLGLDATGKLRLELAPSGTTSGLETLTSAFGVSANKDYSVAVTVDLAAPTSEVTFYLKNLTDNGTLQSDSFSATQTALFDSATSFSIGGKNSNNNGSAGFSGRIDEVRVSNSKLSSDDLLVVPESSSLSLIAISALMGGRRRRGRGE